VSEVRKEENREMRREKKGENAKEKGNVYVSIVF
jgi:hypothetical protein